MNKLLCQLFLIILATLSSVKAESSDQLRIGGVFSLSGWASHGGIPEMQGALLAAETINVDPNRRFNIELTIEDNRSSQMETATSFQKLVSENKVVAFVGPNWVEFLQTAAPIAERMQIPVVAASGYSKTLLKEDSYLSLLWPSMREYLIPLVDKIQRDGRKTVSLITTESAYAAELAEVLSELLFEREIIVRSRKDFLPNETNYRSFIFEHKTSKADATVCLLYENGPLGSFLQQRRALRDDSALYGINSFAYDKTVREKPFLALGAVYADYVNSGSSEWKARYSARFGSTPEVASSRAYDAVMVLYQAASKCGASSAQIQECLRTTTFEGVTMPEIVFNRMGVVVQKGEVSFLTSISKPRSD